jgi:CO/xanthine dehydrogenase Mo-binding subunit
MNNLALSRRKFLQGPGALVVGFSLGPLVGDALAQNAQGFAQPKTVAVTEVQGFIAINADGTVSIFSGKVDLGTGVKTAIAQIAAEELDVAFAKVNVIQGDTLTTPDQGPTFGSLSIQNGGMQIRQACATAREALISSAAQKLGVSAADVVTKDATCSAGGKSISYVDLLGNEVLNIKLNPQARLKSPATYTVVGKSIPRVDIPAKLTGEFTYMQDFKVPGMLHARVIRPKGIGSKLVSFDDSQAKKVSGFVQVIREGNFLAVVATNEWDSIRASKALNVKWTEWTGLPAQNQLWSYVRSSKVSSTDALQKVGDVSTAPAGAKTLTATYDFAIHTHGSIGPSCAVAQWENGKVTCWSASQQTHLLRKQMAQMLSLPEEQIRCVYIDGAGCYGRNGHEDAAADAVLISKMLGKPIRVQWTRADEHGWDPKGPPSLYDYRATLDAEGKVISWQSDAFMAERPKQISVTLLAADLAQLPKEAAHPGNIQNSFAVQYQFPNILATAHYVENTPLRPSWIRTPGRMQNTFANESFLDELAYAAQIDPFAYRLQHLNDARAVECIERVMDIAKWQKGAPYSNPKSKGDVHYGRGVSYIKYELVRTYIAVVADVQVNLKTGKVIVEKIYVAHDCGQIINPDGLRNQIDGNLIQTVSRTLIEEVKFDRSAVTSLDWASYPILKFGEVPAVEISLIDRPNEKPWGAGEPAASVVPSAIGNAIFDAIGVRMRSVPFTPEKVVAAIKNKSAA